MLVINLPFPNKMLWPNGRTRSVQGRARVVRQHREWAGYATLEALRGEKPSFVPEQRFAVTLIVHAKPKGPLPDADNCIAAAKSLLDGIADTLRVNDRAFAAPTVRFAEPRNGRFVVEVEPL